MANPPIVRSCAADNNRACARAFIPNQEPQHANQCRDPDPRRPADEAVRHFEAAFRFETDCWDTHEALSQQADPGFVLLDVRSPENYAQGHVPGALSLPRRKIIASRMRQQYEAGTLFVTYCAGPHCNGAARAAAARAPGLSGEDHGRRHHRLDG